MDDERGRIDGNVKTRTDAKENVTTMAYDAQNRLVSTTDRLGGVTLSNYNCCQLVSLVDAEGKNTSYGYDHLGRRISVTLADNTTNAGRNMVALAT